MLEAQKAFAALKRLTSPKIRVVCDNRLTEVAVKELVRGMSYYVVELLLFKLDAPEHSSYV